MDSAKQKRLENINPLQFGWIPDQKRKKQEEQGSVNSLGATPTGSLRKQSPAQKKRLVNPLSRAQEVLNVISSLIEPSEKRHFPHSKSVA